jgi:hypothetical protein
MPVTWRYTCPGGVLPAGSRTHAAKGVCQEALMKWERDACRPQAHPYPKVIEYLGYEPWPASQTLSERLRAERLRRGLSVKCAARSLGV